MLPPIAPGFKGQLSEHPGIEKGPGALILLGPSVFSGLPEIQVWSRRQESNLYLPLRRRPFYPLNYGERGEFSHATSPRLRYCQRQVQIRSSELSAPVWARNVNRWAMR